VWDCGKKGGGVKNGGGLGRKKKNAGLGNENWAIERVGTWGSVAQGREECKKKEAGKTKGEGAQSKTAQKGNDGKTGMIVERHWEQK